MLQLFVLGAIFECFQFYQIVINLLFLIFWKINIILPKFNLELCGFVNFILVCITFHSIKRSDTINLVKPVSDIQPNTKEFDSSTDDVVISVVWRLFFYTVDMEIVS